MSDPTRHRHDTQWFGAGGTDALSQSARPARDEWGADRSKPLWRGWLHLAWFNLSLIAGTLLVVAAHGIVAVTSAAVYAGGVSALFGASALYHRGNWRFRVNRILQRIDHLMIFVLIAATATPMYLLAAPGLYGRICLILTWALAVLAAGLHLVWMDVPERLVGGTYIGLGIIAGLALPQVWMNAGPIVGCLVVAGGLLFIIGAFAYHVRRPDPSPPVFGYHEVFHTFVCAAATCHYLAVAALVV
jgi:hemolysin III